MEVGVGSVVLTIEGMAVLARAGLRIGNVHGYI